MSARRSAASSAERVRNDRPSGQSPRSSIASLARGSWNAPAGTRGSRDQAMCRARRTISKSGQSSGSSGSGSVRARPSASPSVSSSTRRQPPFAYSRCWPVARSRRPLARAISTTGRLPTGQTSSASAETMRSSADMARTRGLVPASSAIGVRRPSARSTGVSAGHALAQVGQLRPLVGALLDARG